MPVPAQTTQATAGTSLSPAPLNGVEQTLRDIKNPVSWLTLGADFRARNEYFDNILTLNPHNPLHEQDYFRFRARVWASVTPFDDVTFNARLADEAREWTRPAGYTAFAGRSGLDLRDGIFDNLNVQWRNVLQQPATLTFGRQDIFPGGRMADGGRNSVRWLLDLLPGRGEVHVRTQRPTHHD
jgi:hypothetical protein